MAAVKTPLRLDPGDPLSRGLVGFWPLTEGAGQTAKDISPLQYHARGAFSPTWGAGRFGKATRLAGPAGLSTQHWNIGVRSLISGVQVPFTVTAWIYQVSNTGFQPIFADYRNFPLELVKMLRVDNGTLRYFCRTSGSIQGIGSMSVPTGQWVFVAAVISGTIASPTAQLYMNKTTESPALSSLAASVTDTLPVMIGSNEHTMVGAGDEGFNGLLQNVRFWRRPLSPTEINRLYTDQWAGTTRDENRVYGLPLPPLDATISGTVPITASLAAAMGLDAEISGIIPITASIQATNGSGGDTHDGYLRRSRRQRAIEAAERRREAERLADAQALRLELQAAMGMAADVVAEAPQPAVEAVREAVAVVAGIQRGDSNWIAALDRAAMNDMRAAIAELLAAIDAAQRAKALADDDEDVEILLRAL